MQDKEKFQRDGSMLDKNYRYDFIEKHLHNCTTEQLLENYFYYYDYFDKDDEPVKSFSDCIWYIQRLVRENKPEEVIRIFSRFTEKPVRSKATICQEYIKLLGLISHIQVLANMNDLAVYWAKKTIDMVEYFYPNNNKLNKEYFSMNDLYKGCLDIFQKYKEYFNEEHYKDFTFDWEKEFYSPTSHANQNFKYRIHW
jgi:hypothetical protein